MQQELLGTEAGSLFWKGLLTRRAGLVCNLQGPETAAQEGALLLFLSLPLYFSLLKISSDEGYQPLLSLPLISA